MGTERAIPMRLNSDKFEKTKQAATLNISTSILSIRD
jgi:hypothetical protein